MNIIASPTRYGSAYRPACFSLEDVQAPDGVDIEICVPGEYAPLGVKRIYSADTASVNVAPYARRLFAPTPVTDRGAGIYTAEGRTAVCFIAAPAVAPAFSSSSVALCGGSEDAPLNTLLSAAPQIVKIALGERDEMAVISDDWVSPVVTFRRGNVTYTDTSMGRRNSEGILAAVVDADAVCSSYERLTGGAASELTEFTVRLKLEQEGYTGRVLERRYTIDRTVNGGRRLAWVNRYGAIDLHTFPVAGEFRSGGSRTRILSAAGYRTVATSAGQSLKLLSEPCDASTAEWLSELFSSPAVWMVRGGEFERVEVAAGEVRCSPLQPSIVEVVVSPAVAHVSRKL
jgi:hypothetical protein